MAAVNTHPNATEFTLRHWLAAAWGRPGKEPSPMRLFNCQVCGQLLHFENTLCVKCGATLGYLPGRNVLTAVDPAEEEGLWHPKAVAERRARFCDNARHDACNWMVPEESEETFCLACRHNRTIPDISDPVNKARWQKIEIAKRRAFYSFIRLGLPLANQADDPAHGLAFDFLADVPQTGEKVMTGHDDGLITLALIEADDAERVKRRTSMGEPYRTLLGHFRHESGHYFWDRLVKDGGRLEECRAIFGDDTQDYGAALQRHYNEGPPADWQEHFVSTYATAHPWEDFAETWAHYLHIVDTLEMARAFGVGIAPRADRTGELAAEVDFNPYRTTDINAVMDAWVPLTVMVNSLNRCMGEADLYPFVLSPDVVAKLAFIQSLVHGQVPDDNGNL
jgi:hypothetical protein